jgi:hypothetical protein
MTTSDTRWTDNIVTGVPVGETITVPLEISSEDHPGAILFVRMAYRGALAYRHVEELHELSPDDLYYLLVDITKLLNVTKTLHEEVLLAARDAGLSWDTMGAAMEVERSTARDRVQAATRRRTMNVVFEFLPDNAPAQLIYTTLTTAELRTVETAMRHAPEAVARFNCSLTPDGERRVKIFRAGRLRVVEVKSLVGD